jgi:ESCRT-II complex subunit VPS36
MAAAYLPKYTSPPVSLRVFRSGLRVLHTPRYSEEAFSNRLRSSLLNASFRSATTVEIALHEQISVGLAEEMIESIEHAGAVVRDEGTSNEQSRWYTNILEDHVWDGQVDVNP